MQILYRTIEIHASHFRRQVFLKLLNILTKIIHLRKIEECFNTYFYVSHINIPKYYKNLPIVKFSMISGIIKEGFRPLIIHQCDVFSSKHHRACSIEQLYHVFHHYHHEDASYNDGFQSQYICPAVYPSANFLVHT